MMLPEARPAQLQKEAITKLYDSLLSKLKIL
jgi:hypothetical protein